MEIRHQRFLEEVSPTWVNGSGEFARDTAGRVFMAEASSPDALMDRLPLEFAFREFLEFDPLDDCELAALMGRWGLLYHPGRFAVYQGEEAAAAIAATASLDVPFGSAPVSLEEAQLAALDLQDAVRSLLAFDAGLSNDDPAAALRLLNSGATRGTQVMYRSVDLIEVGGTLRRVEGFSGYADGLGFGSHTTLTNALCNQVLDVLADPFEWHVCANDRCGRLHKSIRHRKANAPKTDKRPNAQPVFCCDACRDAVKKRHQRKAKRASLGALDKDR